MGNAMSNATRNASAHPIAVVQGGAVMVPTLLGRSAARIPVAGRIRAGVKVLTRRAADNPQAREIYERGVAQGKGFEAIEREIAEAVADLKNPLTPKNVPYFTVRGEDFPNPEVARQIMELYAEDRGDGVKRLYRFPVVFPADAWQSVMPHELVAWTASERRFWSEYSDDGQTRFCMTHAPVPVDSKTRRVMRIWGGRKTVRREENGGLCDPESCREYQDRKCNLAGRFIFFMPGVKSISAFELPTSSFYAMNAAIQKFQTIGFMRGGRISGFLDGSHTPFFISKRLVEVSRIDDDGRAVRTVQWLIELEAEVDVTSLLRPDEDLDAIETRASEALTVLEGVGPAGSTSGASRLDVLDVPNRASEPAPSSAGGQPHGAGAEPQLASTRTRPTGSPRPEARRDASSADAGGEAARVVQAAVSLGISAERFEQYANKRWGKGWKLNANGRRRALDEVSAFTSDPNGFQAKVNAELDVFS